MPDEFDDPASSTPLDLDSMFGRLLMFEVTGQEIDMDTVNGKASPIRADVTVLEGPAAGETTRDALVFPRILISQLRPRIGGRVLGRLGKQPPKPGKSPAWELTTPTDADRKTARSYLDGQMAALPPRPRDEPPLPDEPPPF